MEQLSNTQFEKKDIESNDERTIREAREIYESYRMVALEKMDNRSMLEKIKKGRNPFFKSKTEGEELKHIIEEYKQDGADGHILVAYLEFSQMSEKEKLWALAECERNAAENFQRKSREFATSLLKGGKAKITDEQDRIKIQKFSDEDFELSEKFREKADVLFRGAKLL
ncbi:MAG: hypothetical protein AAB371_01200 [Patescibacteria group bacterium]|mgnify:FL=1